MEGFKHLAEENSCTWRNRLGFEFPLQSNVFQQSNCQAPNNSMPGGSGDYFLSSIFKFLMGIIFTFIFIPLMAKLRVSPIEANPVQEPEEDLPPSPITPENSSKDRDEVDSPGHAGQSLLMCAQIPSLAPVEEETKVSEELNNNNNNHKDNDDKDIAVPLTPKEPEILKNTVEEEAKVSEELNNNHKDNDDEDTVAPLRLEEEPEILKNTVEQEAKGSRGLNNNNNNNHKDNDDEYNVAPLTPKEPEILRHAENSNSEELQGESIWMEDLFTGGYTRRESLSEALTEFCQHLELDSNQRAFLSVDEALSASMES